MSNKMQVIKDKINAFGRDQEGIIEYLFNNLVIIQNQTDLQFRM
jgi:hypothetical protein